jgi:hypothetical protein
MADYIGQPGQPGDLERQIDEMLRSIESIVEKDPNLAKRAADHARTWGGKFDKLQGMAVEDTWTKETARNLDLSDAEYAGWRDPQAAEERSFQDYVNIVKTHQETTTRLYQTMQLILSEAVSDIEDILRRFDRAGI